MEQLEQLLGQLRQPRSDADFRKLVLQVPPLIQPNLTEGGRFLVLQALAALAGWAGDRTLPPDRSSAADTALSQLTGEQILDFIIVSLCAKGLADDQREQIYTLLPSFGRAMTERLLGRLASEEESGARRFLSDALVRQGSFALPILIESLKDTRWYVVRNCVAILGEIRDPAAIPSLKTSLAHDEPRVRKETVRSLTRIGGPQAVEVLQRTLAENDLDLRRQAVISLGAIRHAAAVPALLKIVTASDPMVKQLDMKKLAIKALAEIGSVEAVSPLAGIVVKRRMFFRARHDELRAAATSALGEIGHPAASEILEWATEDRAPAVARAAVLAVKQLAKGASK
jgi:HEAT repeat protein